MGLKHTEDKSIEDRMEDLEMQVQRLSRAYPEGDIEGHRRYHELVIERTGEIRRLRVAIQEKTISALIWAAIVGASMLLWKGIVANIRFPT